jgi:signal transduction histidine kinase
MMAGGGEGEPRSHDGAGERRAHSAVAHLEPLEMAAVLAAACALSSELVLEDVSRALMTAVIPHTGAERGVLLMSRNGILRVEAQGIARGHGVDLLVQPSALEEADLPHAIVEYVAQSGETVLLDDAWAPNRFSDDPYVQATRCRSVLCLTLLKQDELIGVLYLENKQRAGALTARHASLLEVVASHAAMSLCNTRVLAELKRENGERRKAEELLEQRLAFERLCSGLSADIAAASADALDDLIKSWLQQIAVVLNIERATFYEYQEEADSFRTLAFWCVPGSLPPPDTIDATTVPSSRDHMLRNECFRWDSVSQMAATDRWIFARVGIRSALGVPACVGGVGLGLLVLAAIREERHWPDDLVQRLRLIAEMLGNALARKRAERDKKVQRELRIALEFRDVVIGMLGHDLRTPLSAAGALTQLVLQTDGLPPDATRRVAAIGKSMDRMNDLIGTLLDFTESRFHGRMRIASTTTDLDQICARVVDEQLASTPRHAVGFRTTGPVVGLWDPVRMEQVVTNLLSNAVKHGDPAEPVVVTLRAEADDAVLEVANAGPPIPENMLGTLFEAFRRGSSAESGEHRGLGLGLYIVRQIALAHGGSVVAESTAGRTVFVVRLPRDASVDKSVLPKLVDDGAPAHA